MAPPQQRARGAGFRVMASLALLAVMSSFPFIRSVSNTMYYTSTSTVSVEQKAVISTLSVEKEESQLQARDEKCRQDSYFRTHQAEFSNLDQASMLVVGNRPTNNQNLKIASSYEATLMDSVKAAISDSAWRQSHGKTVLIDVGGNVGDMTALLSLKWGTQAKNLQIHTFEVIGEFARRLEKRFREDKAIQIHHTAMSDGSKPTLQILGLSEWKTPDAQHTGASVLVRSEKFQTVLEEVPSRSLDQLFMNETSSLYLSRDEVAIPFLKIDTEGNDYNVLVGAKQLLQSQMVAAIFFENNKMQLQINASLYKTVQYLEQEVSYNTYYFSSRQLYPLNGLCQNNEVFASKETGNAVALPAGTALEQAVVQWYNGSQRRLSA